MLLLGGTLAFVFFSLPDRIEAPTAVGGVSDATRQSDSETGSSAASDIVPPFRAQQFAVERERAQEQLGDFVDLQLKLEQDFNIAVWGADELTAIKDRANAADALFIDEKFDAAMAGYAAALADLQALADQGERLFEAEIAAGMAALAERNAEAATAAFARAQAMRPGNRRAQAGAERAGKLPTIVDLLREAERAILRADYDAAHSQVAEARRLDPATAGLDALAARIASARTTRRRDAQLSDAFSALAAERHADALAAFDRVLREDPDNASALAGRQQAIQAQTLATIDQLRATTLAEVQAENWEAALAAYDRVLAIDSSLQFARDGKAQVRERVILIRAMDRFLKDPGLLSADLEFAAANDTLNRAVEQGDAGRRFSTRLAQFRRVVERSALPVQLVLLSDNATEVIIHKVGTLGAFDRTELSLRPGRYVIVGSRDGCRDVRKEIVLASGMAPVDIRCAERI